MKKKVLSLLLFISVFFCFYLDVDAKSCNYKYVDTYSYDTTPAKLDVKYSTSESAYFNIYGAQDVEIFVSIASSSGYFNLGDKLENFKDYKADISNGNCPKFLFFIIGKTNQEFIYADNNGTDSNNGAKGSPYYRRSGQKSSSKFELVNEMESESAKDDRCQYKGINDPTDGAAFLIGSSNPEVEISIENLDGAFNLREKISNYSQYQSMISSGKCPKYLYFVKTSLLSQEIVSVYDGSDYKSYMEYLKNNTMGSEVFPFELGIPNEKEPEQVPEDNSSSCADYKNKGDCTTNKKFSCMWIETDSYAYCNTDKLQYVRCGDAYNIPKEVPSIVSFVVNFLKIVTPILLIILSMITLLKALAASKEDEIKKAQTGLIKRLIAAVMVFLVIQIVQFVMMKAADSYAKEDNGKTEAENLSSCLTCFLNNDCEHSLYYRTYVNNEYVCTYLNSGKHFDCKIGK